LFSGLGFEQIFRNEDVHVVIQRDGVVLHLSTIEGTANRVCETIVENVDPQGRRRSPSYSWHISRTCWLA
jgi:hypothetical protein